MDGSRASRCSSRGTRTRERLLDAHHDRRYGVGADGLDHLERSPSRATASRSRPWTSTSGASPSRATAIGSTPRSPPAEEVPGRGRRAASAARVVPRPTSNAHRSRPTTRGSPTRRRSPTSAASAGTCRCSISRPWRDVARRGNPQRRRPGGVAGRRARHLSPARVARRGYLDAVHGRAGAAARAGAVGLLARRRTLTRAPAHCRAREQCGGPLAGPGFGRCGYSPVRCWNDWR